ncbi:MAG: DegV family protein [Chloroflexota bacterium]
MSTLAFVVDSTADLPDGLQAHPDIRVVPLRINWGDQTYRDRVDISTGEFYERLRGSSTTPSTAAPPPADFEQVYQELLATYAGVVSIHLPGTLSATFAAAAGAAQRINPERIKVVEGGHCSLGLGWLAERALEVGSKSGDVDQAAEAARALVSRVRLLVTLDTLEFLQRGGRIGRVSALAGALLNVKPLLEIRAGEVLPIERVRSRRNALRRLRELTLELGHLERIAVLHGDALAEADDLSEALASDYPRIRVERGEISPVVGVHGGPGTVAVTCIVAET